MAMMLRMMVRIKEGENDDHDSMMMRRMRRRMRRMNMWMRMRRKRRMKRAVMIPVIRVNGTFGPNFNIITLFDAHRRPRSVAALNFEPLFAAFCRCRLAVDPGDETTHVSWELGATAAGRAESGKPIA